MRVGLAALALFMAASAAPAMAQAPSAPPLGILPEGRLQLFAGNDRGANFIALDQTDRKGDRVELWYLNAPPEPYSIGGDAKVAETLFHGVLDCGKRTYAEISSEGFDDAGHRVVWLPSRPAETIETNSTQDFLAKVLCDGAQLPPSNIAVGHKAAGEMARRVLGQPRP